MEAKEQEVKIEAEENATDNDKSNLLIPSDDYKKASVIVGTKVISGYMEQYVYKRRADGLAILDVEKTDLKIQAAINLLSKYEPKDILVFSKREAGWRPVEAFGELLGTKYFARRYPAGIITNPSLPDFFEPKILVIIDPWIDKNALHDALRIGIPIISLCDSNNVTNNLDLVIPANNKHKSSIGLIFYLLAKGYAKKRNIDFKAKMQSFGVEFNKEE